MIKYKLASREFHEKDTIIRLENILIGGRHKLYVAGPCAIESRKQILSVAKKIKIGGAQILRGGAFKPRSSPYDFQGLGEKGLEYMAEAGDVTGLKIITEVVAVEEVNMVQCYADILQIGARNMQNFRLLKKVGKINKPVLLKRGLCATLEEWLLAAEYIMSEGNQQIILCERGIRTFSSHTRNTLDLSVIPAIKKISHLPIIVDPSHGTGNSDFVIPMSMASLASGSDGLMVEVHTNPSIAMCDGRQSLDISEYYSLMNQAKKMEGFLDKIKYDLEDKKNKSVS